MPESPGIQWFCCGSGTYEELQHCAECFVCVCGGKSPVCAVIREVQECMLVGRQSWWKPNVLSLL